MAYRFNWFSSPMGLCKAGSAGAVTPTASPYTYTAAEDGTMYVSGGTVSIIQVLRNGATTTLGLLSGAFDLRRGDQLRITYLTVPSLAWVPA